ncbi:MAG: hypothetical protein R2873_13325 [Caldilineaceae bacterium]
MSCTVCRAHLCCSPCLRRLPPSALPLSCCCWADQGIGSRAAPAAPMTQLGAKPNGDQRSSAAACRGQPQWIELFQNTTPLYLPNHGSDAQASDVAPA